MELFSEDERLSLLAGKTPKALLPPNPEPTAPAPGQPGGGLFSDSERQALVQGKTPAPASTPRSPWTAGEPWELQAGKSADPRKTVREALGDETYRKVNDIFARAGISEFAWTHNVRRESGGNPNAVGDGGKSHGIFQFYFGGGVGSDLERQFGRQKALQIAKDPVLAAKIMAARARAAGVHQITDPNQQAIAFTERVERPAKNVVAQVKKELGGRAAPLTVGPPVPATRVYGGGRELVYDPSERREIRPRNFFEHLRDAPGSMLVPGYLHALRETREIFRQRQLHGEIPLAPELSRDQRVRGKQLKELQSLQGLIESYRNRVREGAMPNLIAAGAGPGSGYGDTIRSTGASAEDFDAKIARELNPKAFLVWAKKSGHSFTPYQQSALRNLWAWFDLKDERKMDESVAFGKSAGTTYLAGEIGGVVGNTLLAPVENRLLGWGIGKLEQKAPAAANALEGAANSRWGAAARAEGRQLGGFAGTQFPLERVSSGESERAIKAEKNRVLGYAKEAGTLVLGSTAHAVAGYVLGTTGKAAWKPAERVFVSKYLNWSIRELDKEIAQAERALDRAKPLSSEAQQASRTLSDLHLQRFERQQKLDALDNGPVAAPAEKAKGPRLKGEAKTVPVTGPTEPLRAPIPGKKFQPQVEPQGTWERYETPRGQSTFSKAQAESRAKNLQQRQPQFPTRVVETNQGYVIERRVPHVEPPVEPAVSGVLQPGDPATVRGQAGLGRLTVETVGKDKVTLVHPDTGKRITVKAADVQKFEAPEGLQVAPPKTRPMATEPQPTLLMEPAPEPAVTRETGQASQPAEVTHVGPVESFESTPRPTEPALQSGGGSGVPDAGATGAGSAPGAGRPGGVESAPTITGKGGIKLPGRRPLTASETSDLLDLHEALQGDDPEALGRLIHEWGPDRYASTIERYADIENSGHLETAVKAHADWMEEQSRIASDQAKASGAREMRKDGFALVRQAAGGASDAHGNVRLPDSYTETDLDAIYKALNTSARNNTAGGKEKLYQTPEGSMTLRDLIYDNRSIPRDAIPSAPTKKVKVEQRTLGDLDAEANQSFETDLLNHLRTGETQEGLAAKLAAQGYDVSGVPKLLQQLQADGRVFVEGSGKKAVYRAGQAPKGGQGETLFLSGEREGKAAQAQGVMFQGSDEPVLTYDRQTGELLDLEKRGKPAPTPTTPRIQPAPITGGTPKKLPEIGKDLETALGRRVPSGKTRRNTLGSYSPGSSAIVHRFQGDLDTTAHEVGHYVDDLLGLGDVSKTTLGVWDGELIPHFSQHGSVTATGPNASLAYQRAEGIAEWARAWIVNPKAAEAQAPNFTKHVLSELEAKAPEVLKALQGFSKDVREWDGLTATQKSLANVRTELKAPSLTDRIRVFFKGEHGGRVFETTEKDRVAARMLDSMLPVWKGVQQAKSLQGITDLAPTVDPEIRLRLIAGEDRKILRILGLEPGPGAKGAIDPSGKAVPGLEQGFAGLFRHFDATSEKTLLRDMEDTIAYMIAQRAKSEGDAVLAAGGDPGKLRVTGMGGGIYSDYSVAQATLKELAADPQRLAKLDAAATEYRKWADYLLDYLAGTGRMSAEQVARIRAENPYYVDLHRVMDQFGVPEGMPVTRAKGIGSSVQPINRFRGSTRMIDHPYSNLLQQTYRAIREGDRNRAVRTFTDLLQTDRAMYEGQPHPLADIGRRVPEGEKGAFTVYAPVKRDYVVVGKDADGRPLLQQLGANGKPTGAKRSLYDPARQSATVGQKLTLTDVEKQHWVFEDGIAEALRGWYDSSEPQNVLTTLAGITRNAITHSPAFAGRNLLRDVGHRVTATEVGSGALDTFRGFSTRSLADFEYSGGGQFGNYLRSKDDYHRALSGAIRELAQDRQHNVLIRNAESLKKGYETLIERSELVNRLAEYEKAYEVGLKRYGNEEDARLFAAMKARDLLDFSVAGSTVKKINRYVPFTNARVQGLRRLAKAAENDPQGFAARWSFYVLAPTLATYLWHASRGGEDLKEYLALPDYQRDLFWNYKIGPNKWARIPKSHEVGILSAGVERAIQRAMGDDKAFEGYLPQNFDPKKWGTLINSTLPVDETALAPAAVKPILEALANYDFFRGKSIVPPHEKDLALDLRKGTVNASRVGQILQKAAGVDARNVDHLLQGVFGDLAKTGEMVSDLGRADRRTMPADWLNAATGFFTQAPAYSAKPVQKVLERAREEGESGGKLLQPLLDKLDAWQRATSDADRDRLAREARGEAEGLERFFSAPKRMTILGRDPQNPVDREMRRLGLEVALYNTFSFGGERLKLPGTEGKRQLVASAQRARDLADRLIRAPGYRKLPDPLKKRTIETILRDGSEVDQVLGAVQGVKSGTALTGAPN